MSDKAPVTRHPPILRSDSGPRMRSVPYRGPFVWSEIVALTNYCGAVALLTTLPLFAIQPTETTGRVLAISAVFYLFSGVVAFISRRRVFCPLCKGTPLINTRARIHPRAFRIFPLSHGSSALLTLLFTQTFRCMYCGAQYDLLKPRSDKTSGTR